jgi:hypothetical protein
MRCALLKGRTKISTFLINIVADSQEMVKLVMLRLVYSLPRVSAEIKDTDGRPAISATLAFGFTGYFASCE